MPHVSSSPWPKPWAPRWPRPRKGRVYSLRDHRLSLGVGFYGHGTSSWAAPQADVVLAVGTRLTSQAVGLNAVRIPQRLIHLDIDPTVIGKNYPADVRLVTDARAGLQALLEEVRRQDTPAPRWSDAEIQDMWRSQEHWLQEKAPNQSDIWRSMQRVLPVMPCW